MKNMKTPCHTYSDVPGRAAWIVLQDAEEELESALRCFPKKSTMAITSGRAYFIDTDGVLKAAPIADGNQIDYSQAKSRMEYVGFDWKTLRQIAKEVRVWLSTPVASRHITQLH